MKPTLKQKKVVWEYLKTGSKTDAGLVAYNTKSKQNAAFMAYMTLKKPHVVEYMREIMEKQGLTDEKLVDRYQKIIEAGTTPEALSKATPAHALKALEMTTKMKDLLPAEKKQIDTRSAQIKVDLKGKTDIELQEILNNLEGEVRQFKNMVIKTNQIKNEVV